MKTGRTCYVCLITAWLFSTGSVVQASVGFNLTAWDTGLSPNWLSTCRIWPDIAIQYLKLPNPGLSTVTLDKINFNDPVFESVFLPILSKLLEAWSLERDSDLISNMMAKVLAHSVLSARNRCTVSVFNRFFIAFFHQQHEELLSLADDSIYNKTVKFLIGRGVLPYNATYYARRIVAKIHHTTIASAQTYLESVELGPVVKVMEEVRLRLHSVLEANLHIKSAKAADLVPIKDVIMAIVRSLGGVPDINCGNGRQLKLSYQALFNRTMSRFSMYTLMDEMKLSLSTIPGVSISESDLTSVMTTVQLSLGISLSLMKTFQVGLASGEENALLKWFQDQIPKPLAQDVRTLMTRMEWITGANGTDVDLSDTLVLKIKEMLSGLTQHNSNLIALATSLPGSDLPDLLQTYLKTLLKNMQIFLSHHASVVTS